MVSKLIAFAPVVLKLLMFKVRGIIGMSKIDFFNFSGTKNVKQTLKNVKSLKTSEAFTSITFQVILTKSECFFGFSLKL